MKTQTISIDKIKPNPDNPRTISNDKLQQLVGSIKQFPEMLSIRPIVIDENMVALGGNMRIKACKLAGIKEVPVVFVDNLSDEQKQEFIIKDNVGFGQWDIDLLAGWNQTLLVEWGLDLDFNEPGVNRPNKDRVPLVNEIDVVSEVGDIWQLGKHRLMCGDSTSDKDVKALMNGELADIVWTDPPYNVAVTGVAGQIKNDDMADNEFKSFLASVYKMLANSMRDGAVIYVSHSDTERVNFTREFTRAGLKLSQNLIWNKHSATLSRQDYNWKHEPILFGWKPGAAHYFSNDFTQTTVFNDDEVDFNKMKKAKLVDLLNDMRANFSSTVIDFDRPTISELHPTMKPVGLVQKLIENSSKPDWLVLDLFGGAGSSTLIACVNSNRRCNLMELDPKFVDVIVHRWQDYTGGKAVNLIREIEIE